MNLFHLKERFNKEVQLIKFKNLNRSCSKTRIMKIKVIRRNNNQVKIKKFRILLGKIIQMICTKKERMISIRFFERGFMFVCVLLGDSR